MFQSVTSSSFHTTFLLSLIFTAGIRCLTPTYPQQLIHISKENLYMCVSVRETKWGWMQINVNAKTFKHIMINLVCYRCNQNGLVHICIRDAIYNAYYANFMMTLTSPSYNYI